MEIDLPLVLFLIRLNSRSDVFKPSSNLSTPSRMTRNRSSGFLTLEKAFNNVSDILSIILGEDSGPGG
jgi:hypothetical protein